MPFLDRRAYDAARPPRHAPEHRPTGDPCALCHWPARRHRSRPSRAPARPPKPAPKPVPWYRQVDPLSAARVSEAQSRRGWRVRIVRERASPVRRAMRDVHVWGARTEREAVALALTALGIPPIVMPRPSQTSPRTGPTGGLAWRWDW